MFSRQASPRPQPAVQQPEPVHDAPPAHHAGPAPVEVPPVPPATPAAAHSVIGQDLKILGGGLRLISEGNLTVDGVVEGDVLGANVVIGKHGQVNGLIHGETVAIHGQVSGTIRAVDVSLMNGATVEAEVHHNTLSLELGANFEGRSRRYLQREELVPDLARAVTDGAREDHSYAAAPTALTQAS